MSLPISRQKVAVFGAAGFIGSRLVEALSRSSEFHPRAAIRRPLRHARWADLDVVVCDGTDRAAIEHAMHGVEFVVNCIAGRGREMVAATANLCHAARQARVKRIVHLSSIAIYGGATGDVDETTQPVPPLNGYAQAKWACEQIIGDYVRDGGDAVVLRPSCVYGPGSELWSGRIARLLHSGRIGDLGSVGDGVCNTIYVDDLAAAIISSLTAADVRGEAFNVSDPRAVTWNEFLVRFGRVIGATPVRRISPRWIVLERKFIGPGLKLAQIAASVAGVSHYVPDPITPSLARLWRQEIWLNGAKALGALAPPRVHLEQGLDAVRAWLDDRTRAAA